ncbi:hypothetical protein CAPGI0001_2015 [Capnocytophaga gingivalis ATCC 33624]|nr:hypothetical protein CAPGI0001_2015 [Capnocytophaga gingivalis ATCC 33624]
MQRYKNISCHCELFYFGKERKNYTFALSNKKPFTKRRRFYFPSKYIQINILQN